MPIAVVQVFDGSSVQEGSQGSWEATAVALNALPGTVVCVVDPRGEGRIRINCRLQQQEGNCDI